MDESIDVNIDFDVVDESEDWIVVNKPAPLIVHPTSNKVEPTLLGGVQQLLSYEIKNGAKLSIINRLDRETSGLVLIAKKKSAARMFGRATEQRIIAKEYDALSFGWPSWDEAVVTQPLIRKGEVQDSLIWVKQLVHSGGKPSETRFVVVERKMIEGHKVTRLKVYPKTGRMHQIRVHASYLGHPLIGDKIYGEDESCYLEFIDSGWSKRLAQQLLIDRHALHASRMYMELDDSRFDWAVDMARDLQQFFDAGDSKLW